MERKRTPPNQVSSGRSVARAESGMPLVHRMARFSGKRNDRDFFVIVEEIPTRKNGEDPLYKSEAFCRSILLTSPDCIKVIDRKGRLVFINQPGMVLLGIKDFKPFINKSWVNFWEAPEKAKAQQALRSAQSAGSGRFQGFRKTLTGVGKWWDVTVNAAGTLAGMEGCFLVVSRDITSLKTSEQKLLDAQANLKQHTSNLEKRVQDRTRELHAALEQLQSLNGMIRRSQEQERTWIARELHDELGQQLTALKYVFENAVTSPAAEMPGQMKRAADMVGSLMKQVREISFDLRRSFPEHVSLHTALTCHFDRLKQNHGMQVKFRRAGKGLESELPAEHRVAVTRIVQEALTNVIRHSGVCEAEVSLSLTQFHLRLSIRDKGVGFKPAKHNLRRTAGLFGMQERAELLGGHCEIKSQPGSGTCIKVELPL